MAGPFVATTANLRSRSRICSNRSAAAIQRIPYTHLPLCPPGSIRRRFRRGAHRIHRIDCGRRNREQRRGIRTTTATFIADASLDSPAGDLHGRRTTIGPVLGLFASFAFAFLVLASGIVYLVSTSSSPATAPVVPAAAPPLEDPADVERPKSLQEVLNGGANDDWRAGPAGAGQLGPPNNPPRPEVPVPRPRFRPRQN